MHVANLVAICALLPSIVECAGGQVASHFESAIYYNVCKEKDGGYGPGRVTWRTREAMCVSEYRFKALCKRTAPNPQENHQEWYERDCSDNPKFQVFCFPSSRSVPKQPDVSCRDLFQGQGSKPPRDTDGVACSSGLKFDETLTTWSTIVFTDEGAASDVQGCWTEQSGLSSKRLNTQYPCEHDSNVLTFEAGKTYQTCIEANDDSPKRINWIWRVTSPFGHNKRDVTAPYKSFLDSVQINRTMASDLDAQIVIEDEGKEYIL